MTSVLDLGFQPVANELALSVKDRKPKFPLELFSCLVCGLGQIGEPLLPENIFVDYPYLSSMSDYWLQHSKFFALTQTQNLALNSKNWVLEIASNDGYLLTEFNKLGVKTLGIEPAGNVAEIAIKKGVNTKVAFFGSKLATQLKNEFGFPKLIVANNVMAHVPDLMDFVLGLSIISGDHTLISVENPTMLNLIDGGQFDTIYHEHFSYLSSHAVKEIVNPYSLDLIDVEKLPTHGGSNRYWLGKSGKHPIKSTVANEISRELNLGLLSPESHSRFKHLVEETISAFRQWLNINSRSKIIAYGAAAKGATFLNSANVSNQEIIAVLDASPEKQGKFMPGSGIPILPPEKILELQPEHVLILPWNIASELRERVLSYQLDQSPSIWTAIPNMKKH